MSLPLIPLGLLGQGGTLGFPVIRSSLAASTNTLDNPHSIPLPSGVQAGDLLVVDFHVIANNAAQPLNATLPSGWTSLQRWDEFNNFSGRTMWRIASGAHTSVSVGGEQTFTYSAISYCFSAYSKTPVVTPYPALINTASPNSPLLSVPADWGGAPHCCFISSSYKTAPFGISAAPAGYGSIIDDGSLNRTFAAHRNVQAATEDPGAWSTSNSTGVLPVTIAVRGPE